MKYTIRTIPKHHIAYNLLPFKRNQDVIQVHPLDGGDYIICVVDGWNNPKFTTGDVMGREIALAVAEKFPSFYDTAHEKTLKMKADTIAEKLNVHAERIHPRYASCVACFLIHKSHGDEIVSIGDVQLYLWKESAWYKPDELIDHWIDPTKYPSNVSRFIGLGDRKIPEFSYQPDVMTIPSDQPVLIATDGIKDVLSLKDINALAVNPTKESPKKIVETILNEVTRRGTQRDDISLLVRL
ncbi:MAG: SpoIIE family protein phosphatase [Candidatus Gottesmanbacteria bacterium]|nr:SpoIIE family protein phosphatase [Candidatus Gottesmanbacteria bacterium]